MQPQRTVTAAVAIVAGLVLPLWSQGTGASIAGRVIDGSTGRPIEGAQVSLAPYQSAPPSSTPLTATTDAGGQFVFRGLLAGAKRITSIVPGYLKGTAGAAAAWETFSLEGIELKENEERTGVLIRMWRGAVITGTVKTATGIPVVRASVSALRRYQTCGIDRVGAGPSATTDDRGVFRIADLSPGDYLVGVRGTAAGTTRAPTVPVVPSSYYPSGVRPLVQNIFSLSAGDERINVDLIRPSAGFIIRGHLVEPDGSPSTRRIDLLSAGEDFKSDWEVTRAFPASDGSFQFTPVPAGRYTLRVVDFPRPDAGSVTQMGSGFSLSGSGDMSRGWPPMPDAPTVWGELPVDLADRDADVTLTLQTGWRIRGRVTIAGVPVTDDRRLPMFILTFRTDYADLGAMQAARVEADGSFTTVAVPPGSYRISLVPNVPSSSPQAAPPLTTAAIRRDGKDVTAQPIDVAGSDVTGLSIDLTDKMSDIAGTVELTDELKSWGGRIYIFSTRESAWSQCGDLYGSSYTVVRHDGTFSTRMAPGEYYVAAIVGSEQDWRRPAFLKALVPFAARVTLAIGDHARVTLKPRPRQ